MNVAVIGIGAIGGLCLGYLKEKGVDVLGVCRPGQRDMLKSQGIVIEGIRGKKEIKNLDVAVSLDKNVDLAVMSAKTMDLEASIQENQKYLKNALVVSAQNGIAADYILGNYFDKNRVITGIVMFGSTLAAPNKIIHNFEGDFLLGNIFDQKVEQFAQAVDVLSCAFSVKTPEHIQGRKYLKLFLNLNNGIAACMGKSLQEVYADDDLCRVVLGNIREAYAALQKAGKRLEDLPTFSCEKIKALVELSDPQALAYLKEVMAPVMKSKFPVYGSILQSIQRKKPSEIDYINGEIVRLAEQNKMCAGINQAIVRCIHDIERTGRFLTKEEFLAEIKKG